MKNEPRVEKLSFGQVSRDARGRRGAVAAARIGARFPKVYSFPTHGMTADEVVARIRALEQRHAAKEARLVEIQAIVGPSARPGFTITDAIIRDRGATDVEIVVFAKDARGAAAKGFPLRLVRPTVEELPQPAAILALVEAMIAADEEERMAQDALEAAVREQLEGGG